MEPPRTPVAAAAVPRTPMAAPCTPMAAPCTPRVAPCTPSAAPCTPITLPATPFLSRLGYGTGVSVYLYQRSPAAARSPWAVKKVNRRHARGQFGRRLEEEARVLRALNHPNIVKFKAFQPGADGVHALLMEHGERALADLVEERAEGEGGAFPAPRVEGVVGEVAAALQYLHQDRLLMHGDIKGANILVGNHFNTIKLCDFGVTVAVDNEGVAREGAVYVGTEAWSPREVIMDEVVTTKADMFALGMVIFEMLALHPPHIDKLEVEEESGEEEEMEWVGEEAFRKALGSRPALPDTCSLDTSYRRVLEIFFSCSDSSPSRRPAAAEVAALLVAEGGAEDSEDSVLCVNMLPGQEELEDSVICLDSSMDDSTTTPSAV